MEEQPQTVEVTVVKEEELHELGHASEEQPAAVQGEVTETAENEEPLYVNAKQYHRILKRRAARQRLEELNQLARSRKVSMSKGFLSRHEDDVAPAIPA